jgi:hypothetical protein
MRPSGYFVLPLVLAGLLLSACTGNSGAKTSTTAPTESDVPDSSTPTVPPKPGEYTYENAGVIATLRYAPDKSTLTVSNHTGAEIPAPGIYMLDARDGHRIAGTVQNTAPVATGSSKDFTVTFASQLEQANVGLMILLIGHANYGAFVPPAS